MKRVSSNFSPLKHFLLFKQNKFPAVMSSTATQHSAYDELEGRGALTIEVLVGEDDHQVKENGVACGNNWHVATIVSAVDCCPSQPVLTWSTQKQASKLAHLPATDFKHLDF
jgi:hypothetical protein